MEAEVRKTSDEKKRKSTEAKLNPTFTQCYSSFSIYTCSESIMESHVGACTEFSCLREYFVFGGFLSSVSRQRRPFGSFAWPCVSVLHVFKPYMLMQAYTWVSEFASLCCYFWTVCVGRRSGMSWRDQECLRHLTQRGCCWLNRSTDRQHQSGKATCEKLDKACVLYV